MQDPILNNNLAIKIAEATGKMLHPMENNDAGLIRAAVDFALDITPDQSDVLYHYNSLANDPAVPEKFQKKWKAKADNFISFKKYDDNKEYIADLIKSLSWRHYVESGVLSGSVNRSESTMKK